MRYRQGRHTIDEDSSSKIAGISLEEYQLSGKKRNFKSSAYY
jgi:hypothetical protein